MSAPLLVQHPVLGRLIRGGTWQDLAEGTVPLLRRLIGEGDEAAIAAHAGVLRSEMLVIYDIYTQWFADTKRYLRDQGQDEAAIERTHAEIRTRLAPYHPALQWDRAIVWAGIEGALARVAAHGMVEDRLAALASAHERWRDLHDCEVDQLAGLFSAVVAQYGEPALREMYDGWVIGDWFAKRYRRFDVSGNGLERCVLAFDLSRVRGASWAPER